MFDVQKQKNSSSIDRKVKNKNIKIPKYVKTAGLKVSISARICMADEVKNKFRVLRKCADQAKYQAKNASRDQVVFSGK